MVEVVWSAEARPLFSPMVVPTTNAIGLGLPDSLRGGGSPFGFVEQIVGEFVNQGAELLRASLPRQQSDFASVAHPQRRSDALPEPRSGCSGRW